MSSKKFPRCRAGQSAANAAFLLALAFGICLGATYGDALQMSVESRKEVTRLPPVDLSRIKHVVFIIKENRSFDHYFGTFPGATGATNGTISTGQVMPLMHSRD